MCDCYNLIRNFKFEFYIYNYVKYSDKVIWHLNLIIISNLILYDNNNLFVIS